VRISQQYPDARSLSPDEISVKWLHSLSSATARVQSEAQSTIRTASQELHAHLRAAFAKQRSGMISALKLARAVTMFAAFHFILSALAVLFGDLSSIAGICAAAGYAGARLFHGWLLLLYALWLLVDTGIELGTVLQDDDATIQARVLLIIFQLLVYGAAFTLVVRLLRMLHRLESLAAECQRLLQQQREQLMEQLQSLTSAALAPISSVAATPAWQQVGSSQTSHSPEPPTAPFGEDQMQPHLQHNPNVRASKSASVDVWRDCPPKGVGEALGLCLQVQRQLFAVWGPRAATLRNLSTSVPGAGSPAASGPGAVVVAASAGAVRTAHSDTAITVNGGTGASPTANEQHTRHTTSVFVPTRSMAHVQRAWG